MTYVLPVRRWRAGMIGLAAALVLILTLATPQGRGAAAEFLAQFRSEQLAAVSLSTNQIADVEKTLSELGHLGTVSGIDTAPAIRSAESITEASRFVGFDILQPEAAALPAGLSATPTAIHVMPAHELRFTIDLERARAYYQSTGHGDVSLPDRFHGTSVVVNVAPAVLLEYRSADQTADAPTGVGMIIVQTGTITAGTEGDVTLDELRDFLLNLPGLAPDTAQQLRAIDDWRTTLPIPIPAEQIAWERATIAGSPGLLLNDNSGLGSAAIWQRDGRIHGIAGAVKTQEIRRVAESLR